MRKRFGRLMNINKINVSKLPDSPGVYGLFTKNNRLLKVGRAKRRRPSDRIIENVNQIKKAKRFSFISTKTVQDAIKLETNLIKIKKPPLNKEKRGK